MEAKLQRKIVLWLRSQGAYVIKNGAGPGVPVGCPDLTFFYRSKYGNIEVKAGLTSKFQPGQQYTLGILQRWNEHTYVAYPDNWPLIQQELLATFF